MIDHVDVCMRSSQQAQTNGSSTTNGHTDIPESQDSEPLTKETMLKEGEHLMTTGSNRVGKSSVARVLGCGRPARHLFPYLSIPLGSCQSHHAQVNRQSEKYLCRSAKIVHGQV